MMSISTNRHGALGSYWLFDGSHTALPASPPPSPSGEYASRSASPSRTHAHELHTSRVPISHAVRFEPHGSSDSSSSVAAHSTVSCTMSVENMEQNGTFIFAPPTKSSLSSAPES